MIFALSALVQAALLVPPAAVPTPAIVRPASFAPATSTILAEKKALFPEDFSANLEKTIKESAPVIESKLKTEVAPEVEKLSKQAIEGAKVAAKEAEPVIKQAAADLAPIAKEAVDVLSPIVVKGLQAAGRELWSLTKTVAVSTGEAALQLGSEAAGAAGGALSEQVGKQYGTIDPTTRKTIEESSSGVIKAAAPVLESGIKQATPIAQEALTSASKVGAAALKQGLAKLDASLSEYVGAAPSTPAPAPAPVAAAPDSMMDKLAAAEAERIALLKQLSQ